jgi:hypothetical protein
VLHQALWSARPIFRDRKGRHQQAIGPGAGPESVLDERQILFSFGVGAGVYPPPLALGLFGLQQWGDRGRGSAPDIEYIDSWPAEALESKKNIYQEISSNKSTK